MGFIDIYVEHMSGRTAKPDRQPTLYDDAEMMLERFVALMHVYAPGKIRNIWIQQIVQHFDNGDVASDSFDAYRKHYAHQSIDTVNRDLGAGVRVLGRAARLWRDDSTGLSWLAQQPLILLKKSPNKRHPYPLSHDEQRLLFKEKKPHLQLMAEFDVHTGLRDQELCGLEWVWEQRVPELDTEDFKRSVFVIPGDVAKNTEPRVVVLNDVAQRIVELQRGLHPKHVFTFENRKGDRNRLYSLRNSGWIGARRRAAKAYKDALESDAPDGFKRVRVHDLRHTFGRRLRAAGASLEDRQDLLGHKSRRVTTDYSAAEIGNLLKAANSVNDVRRSPTMTVIRVARSAGKSLSVNGGC
jgi:integrase